MEHWELWELCVGELSIGGALHWEHWGSSALGCSALGSIGELCIGSIGELCIGMLCVGSIGELCIGALGALCWGAEH